MLVLYTEAACVPAGANPALILKPFWGDTTTHNGYAQFAREGGEFLRLSADPRAADVAVLPFDGSHLISPHHACHAEAKAMAADFVKRAAGAGLTTLILVNSDRTAAIDLEPVVVFRTSLERGTRRANEFALPAWHEDLLATYCGGQVRLRPKAARPAVGFCGMAAGGPPPWTRRVKMLVKAVGDATGAVRVGHNDGIYLRRSAMRALARSEEIRTAFVVRDAYFGNTVNDAPARQQVRREYIDNLLDNDYALCTRGYGNFSFRFFEALSLGRIPLQIDTDCVLPYDFLHDYRKVCVIVPERQIGTTDQWLLRFHRGLSEAAFAGVQQAAREFWAEWLSPSGFFRHIALHW